MVPADLIHSRNVVVNPYRYYTYDQVEQFFGHFQDETYEKHHKMEFDPETRKNHKVEYLELVAAFDIESTSYEQNGRKYAWMYIWMFSLQGVNIVGRTWGQFIDLMVRLSNFFHLNDVNRLAVYVHYLPFEFQFMNKLLGWLDVFSMDSRQVVRALSIIGIEFRCSLALTGMALGSIIIPDKTKPGSVPDLPERYRYRIHKMLGDLDYSKIRHQKTPLTEDEMRYCIADVVTVVHAVADRLHNYGDTIATIPPTRTSYVRRDVRNHTAQAKGKDGAIYRKWMRAMTLDEDVYRRTKEAYMGGFTHANVEWVGVTCYDIMSMDITSAYPTAMVAEKFPMERFRLCGVKDPKAYQGEALLITATLRNVESKGAGDHAISVSTCLNSKDIERDPYSIIDNGRIVRCKEARITVTEVDWEYLEWLYTYDAEIEEMYHALKGYLPTPLVRQILDYYAAKTTLKGEEGREGEYARSKESINAIYGMTATDIVRKINAFEDGEWYQSTPNMTDCLNHVNESRGRFLYYCWAPWVTAYTRRRIIEAIAFLGSNHHYTDTDSIKCDNTPEARAFFDEKNEEIKKKLEAACDYHHIPYELIYPKNKKGKVCPLGVWDNDGVYTRFKTLGAKRYLTETIEEIEVDEYDEDGPTGRKIKTGWFTPVIHTTVAGVSKKYLKAYLEAQPDPFASFNDDLVLPARWHEYEGKPVHTYLDDEADLVVTDYLGNTAEVHTFGGVHLSVSDYHLSLAYDPQMIAAFLFGDDVDIELMTEYN